MVFWNIRALFFTALKNVNMKKDFDRWNIMKKNLEESSIDMIMKEWEIWWANIGLNIGSESCWKWKSFRRPILVIRKLSHENCIVLPLSTQIKHWTWFASYNFEWTEYTALLYQIKMIHKNRLYVNLWKIEKDQFLKIKKRLKYLLNL